jgi:hypothetical protein
VFLPLPQEPEQTKKLDARLSKNGNFNGLNVLRFTQSQNRKRSKSGQQGLLGLVMAFHVLSVVIRSRLRFTYLHFRRLTYFVALQL